MEQQCVHLQLEDYLCHKCSYDNNLFISCASSSLGTSLALSHTIEYVILRRPSVRCAHASATNEVHCGRSDL
jgi:hypothetical protein